MKPILAAIVAFIALAGAAFAETQWRVRESEGLDALLILGAASGDVMQAEIYPEEIAWVRAHLTPEALSALAALDEALRVRLGGLAGPSMANFFSAAPTDTIADIVAAAESPDRLLRPALEALPNWSEEDYQNALPMLPLVATALRALDAAGFPQWRRETHGDEIAAGIAAVEAAVAGYDVIGENQRFLARPLAPEIEIIVLAFCKPYGIRIKGQRFITHYGWSAATQLRTAGHELFHPPLDFNDDGLTARLARLQADPWMRAIVETHDPRFGYNSFEGVVDEGSTQALDQIVAERLGVARDPRERWRESDGGMHMLAAALYDAMKADGYDRRGGDYSDWLKSALDRALLTPDELRRRAARVVGEDAVARWNPPAN